MPCLGLHSGEAAHGGLDESESEHSQRQVLRPLPEPRTEYPRAAEPVDDVEEHGREEDAENRHAQHAAEDGRAERAAHFRAGAAADQQREDAQDEGEGGHYDRPQPQLAGGQRRLAAGKAFFSLPLGELHDQDRILARQAQQDHEADLREDVDVDLRIGPHERLRQQSAA